MIALMAREKLEVDENLNNVYSSQSRLSLSTNSAFVRYCMCSNPTTMGANNAMPGDDKVRDDHQ